METTTQPQIVYIYSCYTPSKKAAIERWRAKHKEHYLEYQRQYRQNLYEHSAEHRERRAEIARNSYYKRKELMEEFKRLSQIDV